jgi:hypothetical protein
MLVKQEGLGTSGVGCDVALARWVKILFAGSLSITTSLCGWGRVAIQLMISWKDQASIVIGELL